MSGLFLPTSGAEVLAARHRHVELHTHPQVPLQHARGTTVGAGAKGDRSKFSDPPKRRYNAALVGLALLTDYPDFVSNEPVL